MPIAAPSANLSGRVSPTRARHVEEDLGRAVDIILDGGATQAGLESTIVAFAPAPTLLRPGGQPREDIEAVLGRRLQDYRETGALSPASSRATMRRAPSSGWAPRLARRANCLSLSAPALPKAH